METLVLVLTDVQGSTRLWQDESAAMDAAMRRHHEIVHGSVAEHGGWRPVDQGEGDAVFAAFRSPTEALAAVVQVQRALAAEPWPTSVPLQVRIGVHLGEVTEREGNLYGDPVNRCARLRGLGAGGQTLLSAPVYELVRDKLPAGVTVSDLGEHRMKDLTRPEHVWQLNLDGLADDFPPLASLDRVLHNLPVQRSPLIGRDADLTAVLAALKADRLVTLTGFGGMGKTRLSLQVAAELVDDYPDGAWFVDLAAVTDPAAVPGAVARAAGISEVDADAVITELARQRVLLVLDNLEQVLGAGAFVSTLLDRAPHVRVLATSREPLRIRGERELALSPLALPPAGGAQDAATLSTYAAVQLFVERATSVRADFAVTNDNAPAVAAICQRLDGHPLALELAAARVKMMTPQALLPRLDKALTFLTGGARDTPSRHQTLRATIAWSYDSLEPEEQRLLQRMSVLPAAADFDAVEACCGADLDVFSALASLVDKSLVRVLPHDNTDRYGLLTSISEYAAEQLPPAEREAVRDRHLAHFHQLYRPTPPISRKVNSALWKRAVLEVEHLTAAWQRAVATGDVERVRSFHPLYANALAWQLGDTSAGVAVLETVIAASSEPTTDLAEALLHIEGIRTQLGADIPTDHLPRLLEVAAALDRADVWLLAAAARELSAESGSDELRAHVRAMADLLPDVPADSPFSAEWLHDLVDNMTGTVLSRVDPVAALEAHLRNVASGSMGELGEANLGLSLLMLGRHDELLERLGPTAAQGVPTTSRSSRHDRVSVCALALADTERAAAGLLLLQAWDEVVARASSAEMLVRHRLATAACLGELGRFEEALTQLTELPSSHRWTSHVELLRLRLSRLHGDHVTSEAAASLAADLAPRRFRRGLEVWLALKVEQALLTDDLPLRRSLLDEVQAECGPIHLPYGYQADLDQLRTEATS